MTDQCQFCVFGPSQADKCEYCHLPESMRGECCQYWDLFRRLGEGVFDERGNPSPANRGEHSGPGKADLRHADAQVCRHHRQDLELEHIISDLRGHLAWHRRRMEGER